MKISQKISKLLEVNPDATFEIGKNETKYSPEKIESIESKYGVHLPEDFKIIFSDFGAFSIYNNSEFLGFSANDILGNQLSPLEGEFSNLTGTVPIGSAPDGSFYFYDTKDVVGFGEFSIYLVDPGNTSWQDSLYIASNLTELIEKIIVGEDIENSSYLADLKTKKTLPNKT